MTPSIQLFADSSPSRGTFVHIDLANMFFRGLHAGQGDAGLKIGMTLLTVMNAIRKSWQDFNGTHVIFHTEGKSWRKSFYKPYKANRAAARAAKTEREQAEEAVFWETFDHFKTFVYEQTNCTVLHHPELEADDLIAGFIEAHADNNHVIISTDSDFHQLLDNNVIQYNGVAKTITTINGIYDDRMRLVNDKTGVPIAINPKWILFEKCVRGDTSDNVFSAYPGVRTKGTKNKVGVIDAFNDRETKGYNYNNFMLQSWTDHEGVEHRVLDDFQRNVVLVDLKAQPFEVKEKIFQTIVDQTSSPKEVTQVGIRLMKFCKTYDIQSVIASVDSYAKPFQARYPIDPT
jgi:5'-3' exonuclease